MERMEVTDYFFGIMLRSRSTEGKKENETLNKAPLSFSVNGWTIVRDDAFGYDALNP